MVYFPYINDYYSKYVVFRFRNRFPNFSNSTNQQKEDNFVLTKFCAIFYQLNYTKVLFCKND